VTPGDPAPFLAGVTATGAHFDLAAPRQRSLLIEFHRGTW
jgi:hypothetical protein